MGFVKTAGYSVAFAVAVGSGGAAFADGGTTLEAATEVLTSAIEGVMGTAEGGLEAVNRMTGP